MATPNPSLEALQQQIATLQARLSACEIERDSLVADLAAERQARQRTEAELHDSQSLFRSLAEDGPDVIVRLDEQLRLRYLSPTFARRTGMAIASLLGRSFLDLGLPAEAFEELRHVVTAVFREGTPQIFELSWAGPEHPGHYELRILPERDAAGTITAAIVISRDVTAQRTTAEALRASEERLRTVLSTMPVMLMAFEDGATSLDRGLAVWNAEAERVTGYSAAEMIGQQNIFAKIYPDAGMREALLAEWTRRGNNFRNWEVPLTRKDGERRILAWSNISNQMPVPGWAFWAVAVDVTDWRSAEAALRRGEERLRLALDAAGMVAWEWDVASDRTVWIGDPAGTLGISRTDAATVGTMLLRVIPADELAAVQATMAATADRDEIRVEHRYVRADSTLGWIETHARVAGRLAGEPTSLVGVSRVVTERKTLEAELRRREREFAALVENAPDVIFRHRIVPDVAYEYVSPAALRVTGYAPEEFLADPYILTRIVHPGDRPVVERINAELRVPRPLVLRLRHRDGELIWIEVTTSPILGEDGGVVAFDGVLHDITAHKRLEQTIRQQSRLQEALAGSLRALHGHGHETVARRRVLTAAAMQLCHGAEAGHVLVWEYEGEAELRLAGAADADGAIEPATTVATLDDLPAGARDLLADAQPLLTPAAIPAFSGLVGADERYYLLPMGWPGRRLGLVAIGVASEHTLGDEELNLAATVVEIMSTTMRRWLSVDALQASERRLRLALEAAQMATFELDLNTNLVTGSPRYRELLGLGPGPETFPIGLALANLHPDDRPATLAIFERNSQYGDVTHAQARFLQPDGSKRWLRGFSQTIFHPDGTPERIYGVLLDITAEREAQEAIIASERRLRLALDATQMASFELQLDLGIVIGSSRYRELLGLGPGPDTFPIAQAFSTTHPDDVATAYAAMEASLRSGELSNSTVRFIHPDGTIHWLRGFGQAVFRADGTPERVYGVLLDITAEREAQEAIIAGERRLRLALQAAQLGTFEVDLATGAMMVSEKFAELAGIEEAGSMPTLAALLERIHPEDSEAVQHNLASMVTSNALSSIDGRVIYPDGTVRWIRSLGQALFDESGAPARIVGVSMDVTEQREFQDAIQRLNADLERHVWERTQELEQANFALRESQRFVERVMAASPAQVYVFDYNGRQLIYANRPITKIVDLSPEEAAALDSYPVEQLMHPDDAGRLAAIYDTYDRMGDEAILENEFRLRRSDGSWSWFASRDIVFARGADGRPSQILGAAIDITARKAVEERLAATLQKLAALNAELQESSDLLRTIVNGLADGLALIASDGTVLMANQALAKLYQTSLEQLVGSDWAAICRVTPGLIAQAVQEQASVSGREQIERPDGSTAMLDVRVFPLTGGPEPRSQVVLHLINVTERLQLEELLIQNERLAASGRLAAIVAHEVNSPLQAIQNFLYLAESDDPAERRSYHHLIAEEIDRIGGLIRRLLDIHRPGDSEKRAVGLRALIDKVLTLTSSMLTRHRVRITKELIEDEVLVFGRGDQLTQVLLNLLLNAIDVMPSGGELKLRMFVRPRRSDDVAPAAAGPVLVIEVHDTGPGIPEEVLPRIFEPFFTTKVHGSGLGLAISSQIVEQHGGKLTAHNSPVGGAIFTAVLPLVEPDLNESSLGHEPPAKLRSL